VVVRRGVWQGSWLAAGGAWALLGCTVSPGFEFEDYEAGERAEFCARWPVFRQSIYELTRPGLRLHVKEPRNRGSTFPRRLKPRCNRRTYGGKPQG
jgi:hypothetical protein